MEDVLPTIRRTGAYSVSTSPPPKDQWCQARVDGIELNKLKCARLKEVIDACFDPKGAIAVYKIVNNMCNQAVLSFQESTKAFKKKRDFPDYMSIGDFLDPFGQTAQNTTETAVLKYITDNMDELKVLPQAAIICRFQELGKRLTNGNRLMGYDDLQDRLLNVGEARALKRRLAQDRKEGLLQPGGTVQRLIGEKNST
jgi:hypothetical protein